MVKLVCALMLFVVTPANSFADSLDLERLLRRPGKDIAAPSGYVIETKAAGKLRDEKEKSTAVIFRRYFTPKDLDPIVEKTLCIFESSSSSQLSSPVCADKIAESCADEGGKFQDSCRFEVSYLLDQIV